MTTKVENMQASAISPVRRPAVSAPVKLVPERQSDCMCSIVEPFIALYHHAITTPWIAAYLMDKLAMAVPEQMF